MAPVAVDQSQDIVSNTSSKNGHAHDTASSASTSYATKGPVKPTGALDHLDSIELTPVIGREYPTANLVELLQAPNADKLLRELAYTSTSPWRSGTKLVNVLFG